jgi:hypothetical protein
METAKMAHDWQMDHKNVVFIQNGISLSYKKESEFFIYQ